MLLHQQSYIPLPTSNRVVGLIRVSTAEQASDTRGGIPRQKAIIEETVRRKGLNCVRIFELIDVSGTQVLTSPLMNELLQLIATKQVCGVIVSDLDRLFRPADPADFAILQFFKDAGATIYSGECEYDLSKKESTLFTLIRSAVSGFELSLLRDRQQGAKEAKRRSGKCPSSKVTLPQGIAYDRKSEKYVYTDKIHDVVEMFRLFDEEGLHNYSELGRRFGLSSITVRNTLRNPIYTGWRVIDQRHGERIVSRTGRTYRKKVARGPDEVISVKVFDQPAVPLEMYQRVQRCMDTIVLNHHSARQKEEAFNLGAGIGRCHCGHPLYCSSGKRTSGPRRGYYQCKANYYQFRKKLGGCSQPNVRQEQLDQLIEEFASSKLTSKSFLMDLISESIRRASVIIPFAKPDNDARLKSLKAREKRLLDAYEDGTISREELRTRRDSIRQEIVALTPLQPNQREKPSMELERFVRLIVRGAYRLKRMTDLKEKKSIIMALFSEIYIKGNSIIAFKFRADIPLDADASTSAATATIQLDQPFAIVTKETVAVGHKQCSCCNQILPSSRFRKLQGQCMPCVAVKAAEAHQRRRKAKSLNGIT